MFERHRPVLRRQAGRLLRESGHDPDDVLQDVYLRADAALRGGVVPIDARAWLLRLVRNACLDELRRVRARPVGEVEPDALPAVEGALADELARRAEARAVLRDIHRLPDRQKSVLVLSALDGLTHEEVAVRLDTTVDTTRSLLARARANLRQTAAARETSCLSVRDALELAAASGVRATEVARRHLWTCAGCRAHQASLRERPSRLRRLAGWSPWGVLAQLVGGGGVASVQKLTVGACCALVVGGGAVTVPVVKHHAAEEPQLAMLTPADVEAPRERARRAARRSDDLNPDKGAARLLAAPSSPAAASGAAGAATGSRAASVPASPASVAAQRRAPRAAAERPGGAARQPSRGPVRVRSKERANYAAIMRAFLRSSPSAGERRAVLTRARAFIRSRPGTRDRARALLALRQAAFKAPLAPPQTEPAPPKGLPAPAPTASPRTASAPAAPAPTASPRTTSAPAAPVPAALPLNAPAPAPPAPTPTPPPAVTPEPTPPAAPSDPVATP